MVDSIINLMNRSYYEFERRKHSPSPKNYLAGTPHVREDGVRNKVQIPFFLSKDLRA